MNAPAFFIDRFSAGLDDLTRKQQGDILIVAKTLAQLGRFSAFEASENTTIARTVTHLARNGWFEFDNSCGYPWTKVTLTDAGSSAIAKAEGRL